MTTAIINQQPILQTQATPEQIERAKEDAQAKENLLMAQARKIVSLQAEIEERQQKVDQLKQDILDTHEPGTYVAGGLKVQVREGSKRLNAGRFQKKFPAADYPELYKIAPDSTGARKKLGEDALAGLFDQGKSTVVVK
ncbi:hypothetical protein OZX73_05460 [Bifidobacterium sp. ESL0775]|uniref:hypothetical protein n=1 Tax=Bifidobacterium sp. ESL0775 TaxID=2983230 RepID=UPI0023F64396|nr:hypothetical protein [Bifidobacterium sp. ESL0775]WEV68740.1 hypothetical protein OZX73_05460 [Bifidobacterium sp. ESL0775]